MGLSCWKWWPLWCMMFISYNIDHFDYSCDKFMKFDFFNEK
jgi:hypothetical protein